MAKSLFIFRAKNSSRDLYLLCLFVPLFSSKTQKVKFLNVFHHHQFLLFLVFTWTAPKKWKKHQFAFRRICVSMRSSCRTNFYSQSDLTFADILQYFSILLLLSLKNTNSFFMYMQVKLYLYVILR